MAILNNSNAISSGGYDINNSLRFRGSASAYLNRTPGSATNRKTWTWSAWVKRGTLGVRQTMFAASLDGNNENWISFQSSDTLNITNYESATQYNLETTQVFRDPSAWYHIVVALDTTQATAANRIKVYVNGSQITAFSSATYPSQNFDGRINNTVAHALGRSSSAFPNYFDGYLTETNFVDGQALTPSSFGETDTTTGSWKPKAYTGTYGTNGFYLKFSDIATTSGSNAGLGKDFSGNANYWTTNNISVTAGTTYDAMTDSPTLTSATVANYATLNPLAVSASTGTCSNGNLTSTGINAGGGNSFATIALPTSGKFYWEATPTSITGDGMIGLSTVSTASSFFWQNTDGSIAYYNGNGNKYINNSATAYGATWTTNDVIGVAVDLDAGTVTFYKNNTSQGAITFNASGLFPAVSDASAGAASVFQVNFGQRPFSYTPPTGFVRLNTFNLPDSTIVKGNTVMDATLYTATGATPQTVINAGSFKPDLVWTKARNNASGNFLMDSNRGASKDLVSNLTDAEVTDVNYITSFNSNGYSIGTNNYASGYTMVGWQWQAGQGSTSSNTNGSVTSTVSVNATAGFSVVTFNAAASGAFTIGHGLGVAPQLIITRYRNIASEWYTYHASVGNTQFLKLNATSAATTSSTVWNNTSPTSTVFTLGSSIAGSTSWTMLAYCWAEIAGFSKFGSYTGNGSTDGPFIYTGFRPKFVVFKCSSSTESGNADWHMQDSSRNAFNISTGSNRLFANSSSAETANAEYVMDFVSNGFKLRTNAANYGQNTNGNTYIYMAFAENPFKNSNAR
jgi:hypothetical protein